MNVSPGEGRVESVEVVDHKTRTHAPKNVLIAVMWSLIPE